MSSTIRALARIAVAKILDRDRAEAVLRTTPLKGDQPGWNCISWVKEALERLHQDGSALGTSVTSWDSIHATALRYAADKKEAHRWDALSTFNLDRVATWSMLENKELIP